MVFQLFLNLFLDIELRFHFPCLALWIVDMVLSLVAHHQVDEPSSKHQSFRSRRKGRTFQRSARFAMHGDDMVLYGFHLHFLAKWWILTVIVDGSEKHHSPSNYYVCYQRDHLAWMKNVLHQMNRISSHVSIASAQYQEKEKAQESLLIKRTFSSKSDWKESYQVVAAVKKTCLWICILYSRAKLRQDHDIPSDANSVRKQSANGDEMAFSNRTNCFVRLVSNVLYFYNRFVMSRDIL